MTISIYNFNYLHGGYSRYTKLNKNEYLKLDEQRSNVNRTSKEKIEIYKKSFLKKKNVEHNNLILSIKIIPLYSIMKYPFDEYLFYNDSMFIRKEYLRNSNLAYTNSSDYYGLSSTSVSDEGKRNIIEKHYDRNESIKIRKNYFSYDIDSNHNSSILTNIVNGLSKIDFEKINNLKIISNDFGIFNSDDEIAKKISILGSNIYIPAKKQIFLNRKEINQNEIPISMIFEIKITVPYNDGMSFDHPRFDSNLSEEIEIVFWLANNKELYENNDIKDLIDFLNFMDEIYGFKVQN